MNKLVKYLKKSTLSIIFIVALLIGQAICELALPDYTSSIVNVGIQQGGVENAVPEIIRKSELDKITIFIVSRLYPPKKSNIGFIIIPPPTPAVAPIVVAKIAIKKYNICIYAPPIFNLYT